jgi:ketosteroid isomerase-like protein
MVRSEIRRPGWCLVLALTCLPLVGVGAEAPDAAAVVVADLTRQAEAWDRAIVRKDLAAIAANMTEDFRQIRWNGDVVDKATFLQDITSPDLVIDPYTVEELSVRLYGDVALLSGRTRMTGRYGDSPFQTHYRYIDIYVRQAGRWQVCSVQITKIPPPPGE